MSKDKVCPWCVIYDYNEKPLYYYNESREMLIYVCSFHFYAKGFLHNGFERIDEDIARKMELLL